MISGNMKRFFWENKRQMIEQGYANHKSIAGD